MKRAWFLMCTGMLCMASHRADAQLTLPPQEPPRLFPGTSEANYPLLQELDLETRQLYSQTHGSIVHVEMPVTRPASSQPSTAPAPNVQVVVAETGPVQSVGVVIDNRGHVLVPMYIPRLGDREQPIVAHINGAAVRAKLVGSDKQTNISVLEMENNGPAPLRLAREKPDEGAMVLVFPAETSQAHLGLFAAGMMDTAVLIRMDGSVAGFCDQGQFLCAATWAPVVRQLIRNGKVERAYLGVRVSTRSAAQGDLSQLPVGRVVLLVQEVIPKSAAAHAGMRERDLIVSLAGQEIDNAPSFAAAIAELRGPTQLGIVRDGKAMTVEVDLEPLAPQAP